MTVFEVKIATDIICPWCYLGIKRFQRAVELFRRTYPGGKHDTFAITHIPYLISVPETSTPMQERMESRMGAERADRAQQYMTALGQCEGLSFDFGGTVGRSRDAHRLVWKAGQRERERDLTEESGRTHGSGGKDEARLEDRVLEELFRVYTEEKQDVSDLDVLVDVGVRMGVGTEGELKEWLKSEQGGKEVDAAFEGLKKKGVNGVPWFEFQGTHIVEGAQDTSDFFELLIKIKEEGLGQA